MDCIYTERPDLFVMSRNPFLLALLVHYTNTHDGQLPPTEYALYKAFFIDRLRAATAYTPDRDLKVESAIVCAELLAKEIQEKSIKDGTISKDQFSDLSADIELLRSARLISCSGSRLRFTHRRFLEFCTVRNLLKGTTSRPLLAVGYLDANRDTLTLYGSVCQEEDALSLAEEATEHVRTGYKEHTQFGGFASYERTLIALRFLRDAFRARPDILKPFEYFLHKTIVDLWNSHDLMKQKHAAEHLCLLPIPVATQIFALSLERKSGWLSRAALFEARYIRDMQPWLAMQISRYSARLSDWNHVLLRRFLWDTNSMKGGATFDIAQLNFDTGLRIAILGAAITGCFLGSNYTFSVLIGALILLCFERATTTSFRSALEYFAQTTNAGISGLLSKTCLWIIFWLILYFVIGKSKVAFSDTAEIMATFCLFGGSFLLTANNFLGRVRERHWENSLDLNIKTLIQNFKNRNIGYLKLIKKNLVFLIIVGLVIASTWHSYAQSVLSWYHAFIIWGTIVVLAYAALSGSVTAVKLTFDRLFTLRKIKKEFKPNRSYLDSALHALRTDRGRMLLLEWIEKHIEFYQAGLASPKDDWPSGVRPTFKDYKLNNYLAILDERWRGLN